MATCYASVGFLYHPGARMVLLHHRDANAAYYPEVWASFGGLSDESDHDDPISTWQREMREELGIELARAQISPLREYVNPYTGARHYSFYAEWPLLAMDFALTEGDGFRWFSIEDALALPDIFDLARDDLLALAAVVGSHMYPEL